MMMMIIARIIQFKNKMKLSKNTAARCPWCRNTFCRRVARQSFSRRQPLRIILAPLASAAKSNATASPCDGADDEDDNR